MTRASTAPRRVVIYQMGRVGSYSAVRAVESVGCSVIHIHRLSIQRAEIPLTRGEIVRRIGRRQIFRFEPIMAGGLAKIVSLVRDPLQRNISAFFKNLHRFVGAGKTPSTGELVELFLAQRQIHRTPATWFEEEFRRFTDLDVLSAPFDREKGYQRLLSDRFDAIVMRTDKVGGLSRELGAFLASDEVEVGHENANAHSGTSDAYRAFLAEFVPPEWMIEQLYRNSVVEHFFQPDEIDAMVHRAMKDGPRDTA